MEKLSYKNFKLEGGKITFHRQIELFILGQIEKGFRPPKLLMPGIRELAKDLKNRTGVPNLFHPVESAYKNLCKVGTLYTKRGIGTFISYDALPGQSKKVPSRQVAGFNFNNQELSNSNFITLGPYYPNHQIFNLPKPSFLYEEAHQFFKEPLESSNYRPYHYLYPVLHREVRNRSLNIHPSHLAIIPGIGKALKTVLHSLLKETEKVILSAKCDTRVKELIKCTGAEIIEIGSDLSGIMITEIEALCRTTTIKLVYVEPAAQYPDTIPLTTKRRARLLKLSEHYKFAIIEHNEEYGCYYNSPPRSLFDKDEKAKVIYVSSLSRHIPWLHEIGFVLAPKNFIDHLISKSKYLHETWDIHFEKAIVRLLEKRTFHKISQKVNAALIGIYKKVDQLFRRMQLDKYLIMSKTKAGIFIFIDCCMDISTLIPKLTDSGFYDPPDKHSSPEHQITGLRISLYFGSQTRFNNLFQVLKNHLTNP